MVFQGVLPLFFLWVVVVLETGASVGFIKLDIMAGGLVHFIPTVLKRRPI